MLIIAWLSLLLLAWHGDGEAAQLRLTWTDNANNESGFRVERRQGASGPYTEVAVKSANVTTHEDWGLVPGATYCYRVRAFNATGTSAYSNEACRMATTVGAGEPLIITATGSGGGPHVRGFTGTGNAAFTSFFAYDPAFAGGTHIALAKLDGAATIITGPGPGAVGHVKTFRLDGSPYGLEFMAYDPAYVGGVRVAGCDVDGDGTAEIVTSAGPGGGPHVRVWRIAGMAVSELAGFMAYQPGFLGGIYLGCGDVDGDGRGDIVTGAGPGGGPHVAVWKIAANGAVTRLVDFFAYAPSFAGGIFVAAGDVDNDNRAEIITGAGAGGGPHVAVWKVAANGAVTPMADFFAYDPGYTGGVRVAAADLDGDGRAEVLTGTGPGGGPHLRTFSISGSTVVPGLSFFAYDPGFIGGLWLAGFEP